MIIKDINDKKYHFLYKTTCNVTKKYYIGIHSTNELDDGYLGSGKILKNSIKKHGLENHNRIIIKFCSSREELVKYEKDIVNKNEITNELCMNIMVGGTGGTQPLHLQINWINAGKNSFLEKYYNDEEYRIKHKKKISDAIKNCYSTGKLERKYFYNWKGKKHTKQTKIKISKSNYQKQKGEKNSQFGTCWITNGKENKKIKKDEQIPIGWSKGRVIKN